MTGDSHQRESGVARVDAIDFPAGIQRG